MEPLEANMQHTRETSLDISEGIVTRSDAFDDSGPLEIKAINVNGLVVFHKPNVDWGNTLVNETYLYLPSIGMYFYITQYQTAEELKAKGLYKSRTLEDGYEYYIDRPLDQGKRGAEHYIDFSWGTCVPSPGK